jgi:two-component system response regulator AtoC
VKPFDPEELVIKLRAAVAERRLAADFEAGARRTGPRDDMVGTSPALEEAHRLIGKAAPTNATILLVGESGTGKEVAARLVHRLSARPGPFVAVNLGAVPESLAESELFGHEKGAFTGAESRRQGLFELANGGTIFLDEIGELPLQLQVKLLRVLQERVVTRVGGSQAIPVDARVVAASNRDLEAEVRAGRFREDLFYRVNVVRIRMPPLRERPGDIAPLAGWFLSKAAAETGKRVDAISPRALALLAGHPFPGNVRELANAIERAVILADGPTLEPRDFEFFAPSAAPGGPEPRPVQADPFAEPVEIVELERRAIAAALARNGGRREKSAVELGISRRTLLNKIKEYGLG